ncbi:YceH family protein [soil metagenome]
MAVRMPLSAVELRVLGALVEKAFTTPDSYPLSIGALVTACNQRTSRDPVTDHHQQEVQEALARLRDRGLAATVQEVGDRVPKHHHRLGRALDLRDEELAVLSVLMLRGDQSVGELRTRTERYVTGLDLARVETTLGGLAARRAPLAVNRGRPPGRSQDRWGHTLGPDEERLQPRARGERAQGTHSEGRAEGAGGTPSFEDRTARLEARVAALEAVTDPSET